MYTEPHYLLFRKIMLRDYSNYNKGDDVQNNAVVKTKDGPWNI